MTKPIHTDSISATVMLASHLLQTNMQRNTFPRNGDKLAADDAIQRAEQIVRILREERNSLDFREE